MDYYKKYLKYKNKYLILKKYIGGSCEGHGTRGLVVANPRLPFIDETYDAIKDSTLNEVSKIYLNNQYYTEDVHTCELIIRDYNDIIIPEQFVLPIRYGEVNKEAYNANNDTNIIDAFTQILTNDTIYQITYEKGEKLDNLISLILSTELSVVSVVNFLSLMKNPIVGINNVNTFNIYFKDIKWGNMLYINDTIKIIDYFDIFNFLEKTDETICEIINNDTFINNIFYDANNPIASLLILYYTKRETTTEYYDILMNHKREDNKTNKYIHNMIIFLNNIIAQYNTKRSVGLVDIYLDVECVKDTDIEIVSVKFINVLYTLKGIYEVSDKNKQIINSIFATYKTELDKITDFTYRINTLLQTNNMYAIGSVFIYYIYYCNTRRIFINPDDYINIAKIIIICYGKIVLQDDIVHITNSTLDTVIQFYDL